MNVLSDRRRFVEGNCQRLTVRQGLKVDEAVKVTSNGWERENDDFMVLLVTDETRRAAKMRRIGEEESLPQAEENGEQPSVPIIGLRLPGAPHSRRMKGAELEPAVLLYNDDPINPTEIPLDTPAGPTTPFMVLFSQESPTEILVTVFTWISQ